MRKIFLLLLALLAIVLVQAQNSLDSAWIRDNYTKKEIYIPMRDGVKLFTSIYTPKDATEEHPILMSRTPYSCAPYGENNYRSFWNNHWRYYMRRNYIIVIQDVRGRWMSEGEFVDVRPFNPNKKGTEIDEASDTYDAIDWLVKNIAHNNNRVGIFGISYPGFYSTMAAFSNHPSLKAVSPQAPVTDWFMGDDFHHNGAFFQMDGFSFYSSFGKPRPKPTSVGAPGYSFPTRDSYKFYLESGGLKDLAVKMGPDVKFWQDLYQHPNYDDWWKARNPRNFTNYVPNGTATLVVGGLFDAEDCFGAWRTYEAIEKKAKNNNRIVMGPWFHGQWARADGTQLGNVKFGSNTSEWYQNNIEMPFFKYHLEGKGDISTLAEATIFFTGENKWRNYEQWPPAAKEDKAIYLQPNGKLDWNKPAGKNSFSEYISDPSKPVPYTEDVHNNRTVAYMTDDQRFAARRNDVLVYQTDVLSDDVTLAGTVIANLLTSISTTDADFVVKVIDVFPDKFSYAGEQQAQGRAGGGSYLMDAYQMLVRGEIMRGKFRNSFETPVPFKPNKIETVKFELPDVAHTFKKGHRIMIQIQSSWFPLADRNPQKFVNIYEANPEDFQKATIRIHHDAVNASSIILPVVK
ncbi:MAG: CocE/NonD family hydrolase [Sphingobacteriales bacterium]|nr:MAG: CocE/NonD family hydrolase [Sphingobacteriales bacterium]